MGIGHQNLFKGSSDDGSITWRCRQYKKFRRNSTLVTQGQSILRVPTVRSHVGDPVQTEAEKVKASIRQRASNSDAPTRNIVGGQLSSASSDVLQRLPRKTALEQCILEEENGMSICWKLLKGSISLFHKNTAM